MSPIERYILEAGRRTESDGETGPGSIFSGGARLADLARDTRALRVDDLVTIVVSERASALAKGTTSTARKSSSRNSISSIFGPVRVGGPLAELGRMSGDTQLDGEGETSRQTVLTTTMTARVTHVLGNGNLVIEAAKDVLVNSERQVVTVRGIARPTDVGPANQIRSDRLAMLEIALNGKGVVGDAIRRPNLLYRILAGLLPF